MKMPSLPTGIVKSTDGFWVLLDMKAYHLHPLLHPLFPATTFFGQRYVTSSETSLNKEILLTGKFIREITMARAKKAGDFWGSYYAWKKRFWSGPISQESWTQLHEKE